MGNTIQEKRSTISGDRSRVCVSAKMARYLQIRQQNPDISKAAAARRAGYKRDPYDIEHTQAFKNIQAQLDHELQQSGFDFALGFARAQDLVETGSGKEAMTALKTVADITGHKSREVVQSNNTHQHIHLVALMDQLNSV